ncbi:MAG: tyrosine-type recombinase/integrase [Verrucomicrobiales bacterium]|nr:tyrosine-type recombinase/integrase [Verrucomicrobiales bacterium]
MTRRESKTKEWPRKVTVGNVSVKVYRRTRANGSYGFEVSDYSSGVRRLRAHPTAERALADAERIARLMAAGESHAAQVNGRDMASYGRALELLRPTGVALEVAAASFAEAFAILGGNRIAEAARFLVERDPRNLPEKSVAECVDELLKVKESRGASPRYLGDLRNRLRLFADSFKVPIASVTTGDAQRWLDGMKGAAQTVRNFRTVAGTLFSFAEARGYIPRGANPVEATENVKAKNGGTVAIYRPEELAALLAAAPEDFRPLVALAAFTGARSAELLRLSWQDVDLAAGGFVTLAAEKTKTKARRLVPVCPALRAWLAPYASQTGKVWKLGPDCYHKRAAATARAAGIKWLPNGLRHSYASHRLAATQDAARVSLEMGNSPAVVFKFYREVVKPADAERWFSVTPSAPSNIVALEAANA